MNTAPTPTHFPDSLNEQYARADRLMLAALLVYACTAIGIVMGFERPGLTVGAGALWTLGLAAPGWSRADEVERSKSEHPQPSPIHRTSYDADRQAAFRRSDMATVFPAAHYANQCWVLEPARRRFAMLGIHGQFAWFDLPAELMIVGTGSFPVQVAPTMIDALRQLWNAIAGAVAGH